MKTLWDYRRTSFYAAVALAALAVIVVWAYKNEWLIHRTNAPQRSERPAVVHQTLTPSNIDQVQSWFGPWTSIDSGLTQPGRLVLIRADGSTSGSSWTVNVDGKWTVSDIPQIDQLTYKSRSIEFTTGGLAIYKVAYNQPFVIEQLPNKVYAFVNDNGKHRIMSSTTHYVRLSGHKA